MVALRDRLRISRRTAIIIALAAFMVLLAGISAAGSSPAACSQCHAAEAEGLSASSHSGIKCYTCHLESGAWSYPGFKSDELLRMYPAALLGKTGSGPIDSLSSAPCLTCHEDVLRSAKPTGSQGLRILHRECAAAQASCDTCHSTAAHGTQTRNPQGPVMDDCISCHSKANAPLECTTCHEGKLATDRIDTGTFSVTHGPKWRTTHGLGDLDTCKACHTAVQCADCHTTPIPHPKDFGSVHGDYARKDRQDCSTCHKGKNFCSDCHTMPMPHTPGFMRAHSRYATSVADKRCAPCHDETDCRRCHNKHVHPGGARGVPVPPKIPSTPQGSAGS